MKSRLVFAFAAVLALAPLSAQATSSPNPSLDTILVAPPTADYAELPSSQLDGSFTAHDWAMINGPGLAATQTEAVLNTKGFVEGYGKTWAQAASGHGLVEIVMAFKGGQGATQVLASLEQGDKSDSAYVHADVATGINPYYGAHLVYTDNQVGDLFGFVKGNDLFAVLFLSSKDDVGDLAVTQAERQYSQAPAFTIPRSEWPENASRAASFPVALFGAGIGFIVVVVGILAVLLLRRPAPPAGVYSSFVPTLSLQMSPDGSYWWDGDKWQDASQTAPPHAERSPDGNYWWDGNAWRLLQTPPAPPG